MLTVGSLSASTLRDNDFKKFHSFYHPLLKRKHSRSKVLDGIGSISPETAKTNQPAYEVVIEHQKTDERRLLCGCTAFRWQTFTRHVPAEGLRQEEVQMTTDAWYIEPEELSHRFPEFTPDPIEGCISVVTSAGNIPTISSQSIAPKGLCVLSETWTIGSPSPPSNRPSLTKRLSSMKVLDIIEESLPEDLFEPPSGFRRLPLFPGPYVRMRASIGTTLSRIRARLHSGETQVAQVTLTGDCRRRSFVQSLDRN